MRHGHEWNLLGVWFGWLGAVSAGLCSWNKISNSTYLSWWVLLNSS